MMSEGKLGLALYRQLKYILGVAASHVAPSGVHYCEREQENLEFGPGDRNVDCPPLVAYIGAWCMLTVANHPPTHAPTIPRPHISNQIYAHGGSPKPQAGKERR